MPFTAPARALSSRLSRVLPPSFRTKGGDQPDRAAWRSLRYPSMRWWSAANLLSNTGTWMQLTVQNLLVLQVTGSAATTGLSIAVQAGPGLLLSLVGGAAVDSWPRKLTATVSQLVLGLVAFATAALVAFDMLNTPVLMGLAAVTGIIATVDNPACSLLGNDLVEREDVPSAIAIGSLVHSVGRLGGTAFAGVAVAAFGTASAYAVNGVTFLAVAMVIPFLKLIRRDDAPPAASPAGTAGADGQPAHKTGKNRKNRKKMPAGGTVEGLVYFARRPRLLGLAAVTGVSAIFGRNYQLTLAVLVTGPLAGGAGDFGTVSTVLAVGGIIGAVLAGRLQKPSVRLVAALAAVGGALQIFGGLAPSLLVLLIVVAPMAVAESVSDTAGTTVLQTDPAPHMRGRVLGVWRSISTGWGLIGPPLLGVLMEFAGSRGGLIIGGLAIVLTTGIGELLLRRRRTTDVSLPRPRTATEANVQPALSPAA